MAVWKSSENMNRKKYGDVGVALQIYVRRTHAFFFSLALSMLGHLWHFPNSEFDCLRWKNGYISANCQMRTRAIGIILSDISYI